MPQPFNNVRPPRPPNRRLRAFAFDPSLSQQIQTADINEVILKMPWEDDLQEGPVDEYLEVVDVDPASDVVYPPVDLNHPDLLAQDGLPPSEGNPQFHQQMVYAVARTTIQNFEEALGRRALWSPRRAQTATGVEEDVFVRRLRIYPHALREANAFYSPEKKALLFGYFPASSSEPGVNLPGGMVFTCLSHDIVAHETAHALLDGMHRRFIEPSNVDVLALHEAFADIVALLQHFSYPNVLRDQIGRTRGSLDRQNLLAQLAWQFGQATGQKGARRDALGKVDEKTKLWKPKKPDPLELRRTSEPHARGAILVAAIFDAYLTIYKQSIADLLRIATAGSGVLPVGELHPDLVGRLADEAAKIARRVLHICIRALDYCPPVDINFGDYLRALITADRDMVPDDRCNYRLAFIDAFRRYGIYPLDVRSLAEESLLWQPPEDSEECKQFEEALHELYKRFKLVPGWGLKSDRKKIYDRCNLIQRQLHDWLVEPRWSQAMHAIGLTLNKDAPKSIYRPKQSQDGRPAFEIHAVRPAYLVGQGGQRITDLVVEITQRRRGYLQPAEQQAADAGTNDKPPDFVFRGGCTLLIDVENVANNREDCVRYYIGKGIESARRLEAQRRFFSEPTNPSLWTTYFGELRAAYGTNGDSNGIGEPFAMLSRSYRYKEEV